MLFPAFFCVSLKILETSGMADFHEICHPLKLPKSHFYDRRRPIDEYYDYWGCKDKDFDPEVFESSGVANATVD